MKKIWKGMFIFTILFISMASISYAKFTDDEYTCNLKRDLLVLMVAYPKAITGIEKDEKGLVYIVMNDGKKILYDDMKEKNNDQRFYNTDLQDTLFQPYPLEKNDTVMKVNIDPGRARCYNFLKSVYGGERNTIERNLIYVPTYYGDIMFTKVNGASENIKLALNAVGKLVESNPKVGTFVTPLSGTYNYRVIQDTGQLSPHAFGIAIDLRRDDADYWKWGKPELANKRISNYPKELVQIFEEQGFIWGGKWAHYDILHFEYRPEIILKAKYFGDCESSIKKWYNGAPDDDSTEYFIKTINSVIDN